MCSVCLRLAPLPTDPPDLLQFAGSRRAIGTIVAMWVGLDRSDSGKFSGHSEREPSGAHERFKQGSGEKKAGEAGVALANAKRCSKG